MAGEEEIKIENDSCNINGVFKEGKLRGMLFSISTPCNLWVEIKIAREISFLKDKC